MDKKNVLIVSIILILVFLGLMCSYYISYELNHNNNEVTLTVYSEGPNNLKDITADIKNSSYYKGYNPNTLKWMESLPADCVWMGNDSIVIMNHWDSMKIPTEYVCDAYTVQTIKCNLIENRSLFTDEASKDVYYVKNVEFVKSETYSLDLA